MQKDRSIAIYYTTATCNLRCKYCVIDKNPALKKIDDILDESFKGDYYFNYTKELFPDPQQLKEVQIWGGEPYLAMHRIYYTLEKLLEYYPNLNTVFGSTNLLAPKFINELTGLLAVMGKAKHAVTFSFQLSLDGTQEITDLNRGPGVTKRISERMIELAKVLPSITPNNVVIQAHFKPTLDRYSLRLLDTKEKIITYYNFFEQFYRLWEPLKQYNIFLTPSCPNFATPSDFTQEDGIFFRDFCRMTRELERDHPFKYYNIITPFAKIGEHKYLDSMYGNLGLCGTGRATVGLLPNRTISCCHMAFVDLLGDYKKAMSDNVRVTSVDENMFSHYYANEFCFPVEKLEQYEQKVDYFYKEKTVAKVATAVAEIIMLAYAGQIQPKYKKQEEAIKGANFVLSYSAFCPKDNVGVAGTFYAVPLGTLKIFLNGAEDLIAGGI